MIPKNWQKKVKNCCHCDVKPTGLVCQKIYADDIGGRIFCPKCYKTFTQQTYNITRYMMWKCLVEGWNKIN